MKKFLLIFLMIVLIANFCACTDSKHEVDDYAYVIAMGIDKGDGDNLKVTLAFANPNVIGSGGSSIGGSGETGDDKLIIFSTQSSGMFNSLNVANDNISKLVNLSHIKFVVFSKEIAEQGISKYIEGLIRELHINPSTIVSVCDTDCENYLKSISPKLEINPEKYLDELFEKKKTAFLSKSTLYDFFKYGKESGKDIVAPYVGVKGEEKSEEYSEDKKTGYNIDDYQTSDVPQKASNKSVVLGNAYFKKDKMVATGTNIENFYHLLLKGKAQDVAYTIKDKDDNKIEVLISQNKDLNYKIDVSGKNPKLKIEGDLQLKILSLGGAVPKKDAYLEYEKIVKKDLTKGVYMYLEKIVKMINVDVLGVGNYAKKQFLTWNDWKKYDWDSKYKNLEYEVLLDPQMLRFGLIDKSLMQN